MRYHIDTGLIIEKFSSTCDCPLCEIQKIVEEQFLFEFLNDAVMEDTTRIAVGKKGFCAKHVDMLLNRQNKLSVALQLRTRLDKMYGELSVVKTAKSAKKRAVEINKAMSSCIICDFVEESMEKYYKTIAQMYMNERDFCKLLVSTKGFCLPHYVKLLEYSSYAGFLKNNYAEVLSTLQNTAINDIYDNLKVFCDKHDYRNANKPLGSAERALPDARVKLYGKKLY